MADITMCSNQECISGDFCERQTAKRNPRRQSFAFYCGDEEGWTKCDHYMPNDKARTFDILAGRQEETKKPIDFQSLSRVFRKDGRPALIKILDLGSFPLYYAKDTAINFSKG